MINKILSIATLLSLVVSCKQADNQPCDDHFIKGNNCLLSSDFDSALKEFDIATKENSKNAYAYYGKGLVAMLQGDFRKVIQEDDKALQADPTFVFGYFQRGNAFAAIGQHKKAVVDMDKVLELKPDFLYGYYTRATYRHALGDIGGAIEDMTKVINLNPKYGNAYFYRGSFNGEAKKYQLAVADLEMSIECKTDNVAANTVKGYCEYMLGRKKNACVDFLKGKAMGDTNAEAYIGKLCK